VAGSARTSTRESDEGRQEALTLPRTIPAMKTPAGARELVVAAATVVVLSRFAPQSAAWLIAGLLLAGVAIGWLQILGDLDPATQTAGVPIESLILPAILAFAAVGVMHVLPIGLALAPAAVAIGWILLRATALEARLVVATTRASAADRMTVLILALVAALASFSGVAALVPGALPDPSVPDVTASPSLVLLLAAADGLVAFLLGYRVAAIRSSSVRDVGWAASTAAAVVAIAAAVLRVLDIPGFLGPALLVLVFFLWDAMHGGTVSRRREPRRIWETALLVALGLVVVMWSLGLRA
jgi:hypothetical protein